jgi:uncharacterized protein
VGDAHHCRFGRIHRTPEECFPWNGQCRGPALHPASRRTARLSQGLDDKTLGFADFAGNRQYITLGNLSENPKAFIFLIDYRNRQRIKMWGEARLIEDDPELIKKLKPDGYRASVEQAILFTVSAWDSNCPQHIPQRLEAAEVKAMLAERDKRIEDLSRELDRLRKAPSEHR